jgi:L-asparagine transporter-like permease
MLAIICLYPFNKLATQVSPFVDVFVKIGITKAAIIMNIVAITATLSAFNSCLYSSSRILYSLALHNNPKGILTKTSKTGMPRNAVFLTGFIILITVIINFIFPEKAIMYLLTVATCSILITWFIILMTHIYFRKKYQEHKLEFKLRFFPYANWFAIIVLVLIMIVMTQMNDMKWSIYITPVWLVGLSIFYIIGKCKSNTQNIKKVS